ncbi:MAG: type II secretion system F family protein [Candidatus Methanoperedens sp.]|nr:type II secretion system F family protein [Candidatus Methanoperedens sp.]
MNLKKFDSVSYRIFGKWVEKRSGEYLELSHKLMQAHAAVPYEVYVSRSFLISLLLSVPGGIIAFIIFYGLVGIPLLISILLLPLMCAAAGVLVYGLMMAYPYYKANARGRSIDIVLPHVVALMHALSRGSSDISAFFKVVASNKKIYGEISEEVKGTLIDTKILSIDFNSALKNAANNTPSESYKNFLESLSTVISGGGNLVAYFLTKSEQYRLKALNSNKEFMENLAVLAEVYVTGIAVGPLFIIVLLVVLGLIGGAKYYFFLLLIVYLIIPAGGIFFIFLLDSMMDGIAAKFIKIEEDLHHTREDKSILKGVLRERIYYFIKDPFKILVEVPEKVLWVSVPAGLIFFVLFTFGYYNLDFEQLIYMIDDYLIFTAIIILTPYALFVEVHFSKINQISSNFPEFLNRLVSLHESGLTVATSIKRLMSSNLGILNSEVRKINTDIELGDGITGAFRNFGNRVNTVTVQRVVVVIENAMKMTGNVKDTLVIAAGDAINARSMEEERSRSIKMYVLILYIAFFVFLYVVWSLVTGFFPQMPEAQSGAVTEIAGEGISISGFDKALYIRLFFHAAVLEGFFSGLVAGMLGEGDVRLGLKHGLVMVTIAYIMFMFL